MDERAPVQKGKTNRFKIKAIEQDMDKYFEFLKNYSKEERRHTFSDGNAPNEKETIIFNEDIE